MVAKQPHMDVKLGHMEPKQANMHAKQPNMRSKQRYITAKQAYAGSKRNCGQLTHSTRHGSRWPAPNGEAQNDRKVVKPMS